MIFSECKEEEEQKIIKQKDQQVCYNRDFHKYKFLLHKNNAFVVPKQA
jgi:hypothetical protein